MMRTFATYIHNPIGFPRAVLKLTEEYGKITSAYVTIKGVIDRQWTIKDEKRPVKDILLAEAARFDDYVRKFYSSDVSMQG